MVTLRESLKVKDYRSFARIAVCAVEEQHALQPGRGNVLNRHNNLPSLLRPLIRFTNHADGALPQTPPLTAAEARGELHT